MARMATSGGRGAVDREVVWREAPHRPRVHPPRRAHLGFMSLGVVLQRENGRQFGGRWLLSSDKIAMQWTLRAFPTACIHATAAWIGLCDSVSDE